MVKHCRTKPAWYAESRTDDKEFQRNQNFQRQNARQDGGKYFVDWRFLDPWGKPFPRSYRWRHLIFGQMSKLERKKFEEDREKEKEEEDEGAKKGKFCAIQ